MFIRHFSKLARVEHGLAVFTRQKLTWVSLNPGRTRISLYRVNWTLVSIFGQTTEYMIYTVNREPIRLPEIQYPVFGI